MSSLRDFRQLEGQPELRDYPARPGLAQQLGRRRPLWRTLLLFGALLGYAACGDGEGGPPSVGTNSNWFRMCSESEECSGLACMCGACSSGCVSDDDCAALVGARCVRVESPAAQSTCTARPDTSLCMPSCDPGGCEPTQSCVDGACVLMDLPESTFCGPAEEPGARARRWEDELLIAVQALRSGGGDACGASPARPAPLFNVDARLTCVARVRALDIASVGRVDLLDSAGRTPEERLAAAGYPQTNWGEAFAFDATSPAEALELMREDVASCERLSDAALVDIGIGVADNVAVVFIATE